MVAVENTGKGALNMKHARLKPGVTELEDDVWEKCKGENMTRHFLDIGLLKVLSSAASPASKSVEPTSDSVEEVEEAAPEEPEELPTERMNATDAKAFVKNCRSVEVLEEMYESEDRSSVLSAIEKRLDQLNE